MKKFTGLVDLIHVQASHEGGCFNKDLTKGRRGRPFLSKKSFSLDSLIKDFEIHF